MRFRLILLFAVALFPSIASLVFAQAPAPPAVRMRMVEAGDTVIISSRTELKDGDTTLLTIEPGTRLKAKSVEGDWVAVTVLRGQETIRGWVELKHLSRPPIEFAKELYQDGLSSMRKGNADAAILYFNESIRLNSKDAMPYMYRAICFKTKGNLDRAVADCGDAIRLNPNIPAVYGVRGDLDLAKELWDLAIADYSALIRLNPAYAPAYSQRAKAYRAKGETDLAERDQRQATQRASQKP